MENMEELTARLVTNPTDSHGDYKLERSGVREWPDVPWSQNDSPIAKVSDNVALNKAEAWANAG